MLDIKNINSDDEKSFRDFLDHTSRNSIPQLIYSELNYPHDSILVAYKLNHNSDIFAEKYSLFCDKIFDNIIVYNSGSKSILKTEKNGSYLMYSGFMIKDRDLFFGSDEIYDSDILLNDVTNLYGEYVKLKISPKGIELSSDFFGMSPWFFYHNNDVFVASNNYHLLLLCLKGSDQVLKLDIKRSRVNLITTGFIYGCSFTDKLDVDNCYIKLPYENVTFCNGILSTIKTELFYIMQSNEEWDESKYDDYLRKAKDEMYDNVYSVFNHKQFSTVVLDVSGGFDSRILFSTSMSLPKSLKNKIVTHTRKSGTIDDEAIATTITNCYRYPKVVYNNIDISELLVDKGIYFPQVSKNLGCYYSVTYLNYPKYNCRNRIQLTGQLGETILGLAKNRGELNYSIGDQKLLSSLDGCYFSKSISQLKDVFNDESEMINNILNLWNCNDLFKKFQIHYTCFRNVFQVSSVRNVEYNNLRFCPLQSKQALKAKWIYLNKFGRNSIPDDKVCYDLISLINPLLSKIPFSKQSEKNIPKPDDQLSYVDIKVVTNPNISPSKNIDKCDYKFKQEDLYKEKVKTLLHDFDAAKQLLLHIYDYSHEFYSSCLCLYLLLNKMSHSPKEIDSRALEQVRKIYDLYYQISIIHPSRNE